MAGESINPRRDVPLSIAYILMILAVTYVLAALALSGMLPDDGSLEGITFVSAFAGRGWLWASQVRGRCRYRALPYGRDRELGAASSRVAGSVVAAFRPLLRAGLTSRTLYQGRVDTRGGAHGLGRRTVRYWQKLVSRSPFSTSGGAGVRSRQACNMST